MEPVIYILEDEGMEVHLFNEWVGVCWNIENGKLVSGPYITFIGVSTNKDGEPHEDKSAPTDGGFDEEDARELARDLLVAADYLGGHG